MKKTSFNHGSIKSHSKPINIPTSKHLGKTVELALNLFNPHNTTPPNTFIETLNKRMNLYYDNKGKS